VSNAPSSPLSLPVTALHGVGSERAAQLARLDIHTVGDLLLHRPRRHEDRRRMSRIEELELHEAAITRGTVVALGVKYWRHRSRSVFELILEDGSGRLHCRWWNMPFMEEHFHVGEELLVFGKLISLKPRTVDHPEVETVENGEESSIHLNRIVPVYPLTEGVTQRWLRGLIWRTLASFGQHVTEPRPGLALPGFPTRAVAVLKLHFPDADGEAEAARRRLALDEFVDLQVALQRRRRNLQANARGLPCGGDNRLMRPFLGQLGFRLTEAQTRVLRELRRDLSGAYPMRRLLQGDVGSGKTVVAACGALMALESGFNVALMAPTEILAEQHFATFGQWFKPLGVGVELLTGARKTVDLERAAANPELPLHRQPAPTPTCLTCPTRPTNPQPSTLNAQPSTLFIGTHALLEAAFAPENLGLVIIDEQHKFGVTQREALVRKGRYPHLLVMTATPIPRTLGLTLYGDLDISVIDALPAGRGRIRTYVRDASRLPQVHGFIRQKLAEGRQAYVVYPRLEEADLKTGMKAVLQEFARLQQAFAPYRTGLLHGRLNADEKERVMAGFRANQIQVVVATSVVEVGLDVPNATVMLVENAESFGLAQLHQMRGRIGRGAHDAYCILLASAKTAEARQRLQVLAQTNDGFRIAEADLRLRGPGELLGQQQSGLPRFRFGDLATDEELIERARELAAQVMRNQRANERGQSGKGIVNCEL
jgi:ATP-dependent DNA helicase RecG